MPTLPTNTSAAQSSRSAKLFAASAAVSASVILALSFTAPASAQDATTTTVPGGTATTVPAETPVATTTPESTEAPEAPAEEEAPTEEAVTQEPAQEDPVPEGGVDAGFGGAAPGSGSDAQTPYGALALVGVAAAGGTLITIRRRKLSRFE